MKLTEIQTSYNSWPYAYGHEVELNLALLGSLQECQELHSMLYKDVCLDKIPTGGQCECRLHRVNKEKKEPLFGGYYNIGGKDVYIERVIYNDPVVIVFWSDGVKTRSTCHKEDRWNPEFGLTLCVMKRYLSNEQINKLFEDWFIDECYTEFKDIKLKDVRNKHKNQEVKS